MLITIFVARFVAAAAEAEAGHGKRLRFAARSPHHARLTDLPLLVQHGYASLTSGLKIARTSRERIMK